LVRQQAGGINLQGVDFIFFPSGLLDLLIFWWTGVGLIEFRWIRDRFTWDFSDRGVLRGGNVFRLDHAFLLHLGNHTTFVGFVEQNFPCMLGFPDSLAGYLPQAIFSIIVYVRMLLFCELDSLLLNLVLEKK
jgi:hypothetical protein